MSEQFESQIKSIRDKVLSMAELSLDGLKSTFMGFMQHNRKILAEVLEKEDKLNELERELTRLIIDASKAQPGEKEKNVLKSLESIVSDLELIGDFCRDIVERVELKIDEKLLFSERAVSEYTSLYRLVECSLTSAVDAMRTSSRDIAQIVLERKDNIDNLVVDYHERHVVRLMEGVCDPRAADLYDDMLDYTGRIGYHSKRIAQLLLEII